MTFQEDLSNIAAELPARDHRRMLKDRLIRNPYYITSMLHCMQVFNILLPAIEGLKKLCRFLMIRSTPCILACTHDHRHHQHILAWTWALSHATTISRRQTDMAAGHHTMASEASETQITARICQRILQIARWRTISWNTSKIGISSKPSSKDASRGRNRSSTLSRSEMCCLPIQNPAFPAEQLTFARVMQ